MYYLVLAMGLILASINDKKRVSFKIFVVILLLFAFFRYGIGADYFAYRYLFSRINTSFITEWTNGIDNQELGFRLVGSLLKGLGISFQVYISIIALINIIFIAKICYKHSSNPALALLIYFSFYYLVWTFSGLRQGLTLSIGVYYLLECIEKKKTFRFVVIVILLMLIHESAIILLLFYLAARIKFTKKSLIIISLSSVVFALLPWGYILNNFSHISLVKRVLIYMDTTSISFTSLFDFQSIARIVFLVIIFFYYNRMAEKSDLSRKMLNIYVISIALYFVLKFSELTAARLSIYGKILDIVLFSNFYYLYKERINKILYSVILFILLILYFNKEMVALKEQSGLICDNKTVIPYTSIFNPDQYSYDNIYIGSH